MLLAVILHNACIHRCTQVRYPVNGWDADWLVMIYHPASIWLIIHQTVTLQVDAFRGCLWFNTFSFSTLPLEDVWGDVICLLWTGFSWIAVKEEIKCKLGDGIPMWANSLLMSLCSDHLIMLYWSEMGLGIHWGFPEFVKMHHGSITGGQQSTLCIAADCHYSLIFSM